VRPWLNPRWPSGRPHFALKSGYACQTACRTVGAVDVVKPLRLPQADSTLWDCGCLRDRYWRRASEARFDQMMRRDTRSASEIGDSPRQFEHPVIRASGHAQLLHHRPEQAAPSAAPTPLSPVVSCQDRNTVNRSGTPSPNLPFRRRSSYRARSCQVSRRRTAQRRAGVHGPQRNAHVSLGHSERRGVPSAEKEIGAALSEEPL